MHGHMNVKKKIKRQASNAVFIYWSVLCYTMAERNVETSVGYNFTHANFFQNYYENFQIAEQNSQRSPRKQLCRCCTWHGTLLRT
jgi:hypothetical protein